MKWKLDPNKIAEKLISSLIYFKKTPKGKEMNNFPTLLRLGLDFSAELSREFVEFVKPLLNNSAQI